MDKNFPPSRLVKYFLFDTACFRQFAHLHITQYRYRYFKRLPNFCMTKKKTSFKNFDKVKRQFHDNCYSCSADTRRKSSQCFCSHSGVKNHSDLLECVNCLDWHSHQSQVTPGKATFCGTLHKEVQHSSETSLIIHRTYKALYPTTFES